MQHSRHDKASDLQPAWLHLAPHQDLAVQGHCDAADWIEQGRLHQP